MKNYGPKVAVYKQNKILNMQNLCFKIKQALIFTMVLGLLSACKTSYQSGFSYHKNSLNIDLKNHQLAYQVSKDSLFELASKQQLDIFDEVFLNQFQRKITNKGYLLNQSSSLQTMVLQNCIIDFSLAEPKMIPLTHDTIMIDQLATTLVCQTNQTKNNLFTVTNDIYFGYELISKTDKSAEVNKNLTWRETPNYIYRQKPISKNQANIIAEALSERAIAKLDSINEANFTKNHPELANQQYKKKSFNGTGILIELIIIGIMLLII
jgi:hypothetical protein